MKFLLVALSVSLGFALVGVGWSLAQGNREIVDLRLKRHGLPTH
jgi:hypothetical protein